MSKKTLSAGYSAALVVAFLMTITVKEAHAYIDLGSGSFMLQMLLAGVFASLFAVKMMWRRFTYRASRLFSRSKKVNADDVS